MQALLGLDADVPAGTVRMSPSLPPARIPMVPLQVDGLVAGAETFSARVDADGSGHISGLSLTEPPAAA